MKVVIHPVMPPGLPERLECVEGIDLVRPEDSLGVSQAITDGAEVLATYRWEDRFLAPGLRWVASVSAGVDQFPLERLQRAGVVLTSARGVNAIPVAEHAMALVLACARRIGQSTRDAVDHAWVQRASRFELFGSTMTILGLGAVGEQIALRARAFGMSVIGIKRDPGAYAGVVQDVRPPDALIEACRRSQVLVCSAPGAAETDGLVDGPVLEALGRGILVNVGRGSTLDEHAVADALRENRLRAAGLDVFQEEPLPEGSPLWDLPTLVITPHMAGSGPRYGERWVELFRSNLDALGGRATWENLVVP